MSIESNTAFIVMVFIAVVLLAQGLVVPVFGENRSVAKRLRQRLAEIDEAGAGDAIQSLLRDRYLDKLSPWERQLESLPMLDGLISMIEQAGKSILAYRLVLLAILLGMACGVAGWIFSRVEVLAVAAALAGFALPFMKISRDRSARFAAFEEQLPEAIDVMRRALLAGHPFNAALGLAAEDMDDPIRGELQKTFADLNFGNDVRRAMLGLLHRVPSVTVMALVTSVLVQRETGGNLAEILEQSSKVIRSRFKFHRRVKTLSAEGRLSAWILAAVPFFMFIAISFIAPDYFTVLFEDPRGQKAMTYCFLWACIGVFWIRKIIRIDV